MARAIVAVVVVVGFLAIGGSVDSAVRVTVCRVDAEGGGQSLDAKGGKERVDVRALVALGPNVDPAVIFGNSVQRICRLGAEAGRPAHVPVLIPAACGTAAQDLRSLAVTVVVVIVAAPLAIFSPLLGVRLAVVRPGAVFVLDIQGLEAVQIVQHAFGRLVIERIVQGGVDETGTVETAVANHRVRGVSEPRAPALLGIVAGGGGRHRKETKDELHDICVIVVIVGQHVPLLQLLAYRWYAMICPSVESVLCGSGLRKLFPFFGDPKALGFEH